MIKQLKLAMVREPIRSLATAGFLITERIHAPGWTLLRHFHDSPIIGIVLNGSYTEGIGRKSQECRSHSLQLLPAGESHAYHFDGGQVRCLTIEIRRDARDSICKVSTVLDQPICISNGTVPALIIRLYREFRLMERASHLTIEGLVLEMLGDATQAHRPPLCKEPYWLRQVREFVHENARQSVSLIEQAALAGVHPSYLARMFRRHYGCSVGDYVVRTRLEFAVREVINSDQPLAEIASSAGFYDQSHFTHAFKLHFGMTPSNLRSMARRGEVNTNSLRLSNNSH